MALGEKPRESEAEAYMERLAAQGPADPTPEQGDAWAARLLDQFHSRYPEYAPLGKRLGIGGRER